MLALRRATLLAGYLATAPWGLTLLLVFSSASGGWVSLCGGLVWTLGFVAAVANEVTGSLLLYLVSALVVVTAAGSGVAYLVLLGSSR